MQVSSSCWHEHQLEVKAQKKLKNLWDDQDPEPLPSSLDIPAKHCPVPSGGIGKQVKDRSISPWRYVYKQDPHRFPHKIAVAECQCEGCITIKRGENNAPTHDMTYNSVAITQSRLVLRKELCEDRMKYRLVWHSEPVAVGCTCVRPKN
ncbi:hypothetical protein NHX12_002922 [Muraenolepis orangiensis]|uniref:Interleukin-17C n=1 Tax=Muraenolepis orangiensis TaxID=630683 RepID=A0A9Q0IFM5_9TELE|nr:hypothetical protein NHX12_002922 [Muraenolepis orangiensis]